MSMWTVCKPEKSKWLALYFFSFLPTKNDPETNDIETNVREEYVLNALKS